MELIVLIDYDNLDFEHRRHGLVFLAESVVNLLDEDILRKYSHVKMKLYGGWYSEKILTVRAQDLVGKINELFPISFKINRFTAPILVTVNMQMAYSLEVEPAKHLFHTYRKRSMPWGLKCEPVSTVCNKSECELTKVHLFINNKKCSTVGCEVKPANVICNDEQKLVDNMITADIIYLSNSKIEDVVVVSSDDDLWPGIRTALIYGSKIIHLHTRKEVTSAAHYSSGLGTSYKLLTLWSA